MNPRSIVKKIVPKSLFVKIEPYGHLVEAMAENVLFGFPTHGLKVIGVTGTAGKTTTCTLIAHMLRENGYKVAMMTTVAMDYGDGKGLQPNSTRMTSVGSLKLLKAAKRMKAAGVEWLVLETTSHALAQHRVWSVPYSIVAYTNLSHDNVDYHGTFERYREAKLMLFKQCDRNKKGLRTGVVNADDENGQYFSSAITKSINYGIKNGDLQAKDVSLTPSGSSFKAKLLDTEYNINCNLPGEFNVYNTLCAIGVTKVAGLSKEQIENSIASLKSVEGRMNTIEEGQKFGVIVDYACTPDAFEKVFAAIKPAVQGRIITMFGSAGRRDELKRPIQGEIAGKNSDIIILTEEDDRDQDGLKILDDIANGAEKAGKVKEKDMLFIHDREEAVKKAIELARPGDMVLLLGKGEEKQIITNKPDYKPTPGHIYNESTDTIRRPYNDSDVARAALKSRFPSK
ncbi:MAG TPA: UDP-N-acetylmuramoyl-L-alanyl-D-glutamate--2,6-diaminopimelate ligase [Candidatus Saccharimonadales bacterium]|nr:UDP-N-acetylmuramoyl-L-alanyl-D-glutamate--2,6-diaminopimelate ligase [Candidatus Saccharimonadales bacterium]